MDFNQVIYQIYPLGFCDAPTENDHRQAHRIRRVLDWVDHFQKLGITQILFNPVFESSSHGYDTIDCRRIDARLGTNEDFREVCDALHKAGIGVILDAVFNHVGRDNPMFRDVQERKWDSPYKDWFYINFNDSWARDGFSYADWEGHQELVKLNLQNPEVKQYLFDSVDLWIEQFGIDGLRLDTAYCLDQQFLRELRDHVKYGHPDFLIIGEMINGDYNVLLKEDLVDSVTNYECRKGLFSSMNTHNLFEIGYSLNRQFGHEPWCLYQGRHLLSFVDNHDVDRIASTLNDPRDLPLIYDLMYAMPGMPCIYYGSEWGAEGKRTRESDAELRPCFDKPEWNELTKHLSQLNAMRLANPVFTDGDYFQICTMNQAWGFMRSMEHSLLIFLINISDDTMHLQFNTPVESAEDLLTHETVSLKNGIGLPAKSSRFLYHSR